MHKPAVDMAYMINAEELSGDFVLGADLFIGPLRGIPRFVPGTGDTFYIPPCALFIDSGSAFNPDRFMGQGEEIRYARVILHLRSLGYSDGRRLMLKVMDFLLGKKFYVHPGDPDNPDTRVVWYKTNATSKLNKDGVELRHIDKDDLTILEYLDVYTTSSEPIHSGPDLDSRHFFTSTYNMVYIQKAYNTIFRGEFGRVSSSGKEGVGNSI